MKVLIFKLRVLCKGFISFNKCWRLQYNMALNIFNRKESHYLLICQIDFDLFLFSKLNAQKRLSFTKLLRRLQLISNPRFVPIKAQTQHKNKFQITKINTRNDLIIIEMLFRNMLRGAALMAATSLPYCCADKRKNQVYIWGNGVYQARPDALLQFQNFIPKKIRNLPSDLVSLSFGEYYEGGIDEKGSLWIWRTQQVDANKDEINGVSDRERKELHQLAKDIVEVKFTTGYIWTLTKKGKVIQYPIVKEFDKGVVTGVKIGKEREVEPLRGATQISAGVDHVMTLRDGEVWTMGDDTYGQCGMDIEKRSTFPPFSERRVSYPIRVPHLKNVKKIVAGGYHCLALDASGTLYGWGSNSSMQLSHEQQFSRMNTPLIATFNPIKINKNLDDCEIIDMAAGNDFSILVGRSKVSESYQVFSFGSNLNGQLGIGEIRHLRDITKIEGLSNFVLKIKGKKQKVAVKQIACGAAHTIVNLNIGYVMQWGDNEFGQMGNRKRSPVYSPILVRLLSEREIVGIYAGHNSTGVIVKQEIAQPAKEDTIK